MNVLVLDDDPLALKLVSLQLRAMGMKERGYEHVLCITDAREALSLFENGDGDVGLVICDLQMPGMDGIEFLRYLGRMGFTGGLVLLSGEDIQVLQAAERLARSYGLRLLGSLPKPAQPERLRALLDTPWVAGQRAEEAQEQRYSPGELQNAIEAGELVVHYQPKVALRDGRVVGMEALARWQHPRDGCVLPEHFVPLAEKSGLALRLAHAVLGSALPELALWQSSGRDWTLAVNVSMDALVALDFPDTVSDHAARAGAMLDRLTLELTESQVAADSHALLDILARLRLKRVSLSIDDFGTGYAFLAQLRELPFDELKLDRQFVHGVSADPRLEAIVTANLGLARQLGVRTVAEGVGDVSDWKLLLHAGCDLAQGHLIGKSMPADELEAWAEHWPERHAAFF